MNKQQLTHLMQTHGDYLTRLAYVYVKDWATAEDIVQDVFVKFYLKQEAIHEQAAIKTYLSKMTIHKSCDYLRSIKSRLTILKKYLHKDVLFNSSIEETAIQRQTENEVADQVLALPIKYREVIVLFYYQELTSKEIAYMLNLSENTIKTRLKRAKALLKKNLFVNREELFLHDQS